MTGAARSVAVVTIAHGRRDHLRRQMAGLAAQHEPPERYVVVDMGGDPIGPLAAGYGLDPIVVGLPSDPGALPLARARNLGRSVADADVTVFLDADCIADPGLVHHYRRLVTARPGLHVGPVGYLPARDTDDWSSATLLTESSFQPGRPRPTTNPHRSDRFDLFWSLSFALDRATWELIGGFDERFVGYGGEDTDFARTASRSGVELWFQASPLAFHQHHPVSSPPVEHLVAICRNAALFHAKWGTWPMTGWLREFRRLGLIDWRPASSQLAIRGADRAAAS